MREEEKAAEREFSPRLRSQFKAPPLRRWGADQASRAMGQLRAELHEHLPPGSRLDDSAAPRREHLGYPTDR
jgi:hypothetical protein